MTKDLRLCLVQLGPLVDRHVYRNLRYLQAKYPIGLTVITDNPHLINYCISRNISHHRYLRDVETESAISLLTHSSTFRSGFWIYTLERFFALAQFHRLNPAAKLIHIESDICLLPDFPFELFERLDSIAWSNVGENHDCGAIFFTPSAEVTQWFSQELKLQIQSNPRTTDMLALRRIARDFPERIEILPTLLSSIDPARIVFDPSQYGMYFVGVDPRNHYGISRRFIWWSEASGEYSNLKFSFSRAKGLEITNGLETARVVCLHNHAKNLLLFGTFQSIILKFLTVTESRGLVTRYISPRFFLLNFRMLSSMRLKKNHFRLVFDVFRKIFFR